MVDRTNLRTERSDYLTLLAKTSINTTNRFLSNGGPLSVIVMERLVYSVGVDANGQYSFRILDEKGDVLPTPLLATKSLTVA